MITFSLVFMKTLSKVSVLFLVVLTMATFTACNSTNQESAAPVTAKNIILLIGDGMGLQQMYGAATVKGEPMAVESATHVGLQKTHAANNYITDSAASGTAIACGRKTNNGMIGMTPDGTEVESILKVAERNGKATGLVSTSAITHATPASFIANDTSRGNYEAIAADFLKTDIDVFIGGGLDHFTKREDGRDLAAELKENGYTVATTIEEFVAHDSGKLAALTAPGHNPRTTEGRDDMLPFATTKALSLLEQNESGFFVMVEGSQIDWGGHANDKEYVITETLDFDAAVKVAMDYAKADGETLVIVTADHETGGMVIRNGNLEEKTIEAVFTTGGHTGIPIPVYAYGPGAELFTGFYDNTEFKERFEAAFGF